MSSVGISKLTVAAGWLGPVNWADALTAITSVFTAAAVIFAAIQVTYHNRQMHRDFETLYLQRYWEVMDERSKALMVEGKSRKDDEKVIHKYLDLSDDQVSLRALGRITDDTWRFWEEAIYQYIYYQPYRHFVEEDGGKKYRHLWAMLAHHGRGPHDRKRCFDPLKWSLVRRKVNGL